MKQLAYLFGIILWATISSCSQNEYKSEAMAMAYDVSKEQGILGETSQSASSSGGTEISENNASLQRKIIKEGNIRFETSNATKTRESILKSVNENNGYLANDNSTSYGSSTDYYITIRVPADRFDILLEQISSTAKKIDSKDIKALDVTEEFIDVQARINTKKELENRYKEILKQAHKVEDILKIENEIGMLRSDIESLEGRLRYLKDKVSYSTLTVNFYEKNVTTSSHSFGFGEKFIGAIYSGWEGMLWFVIGLTSLWPFIIIIIIAVFLIKRVRKNRKKKKGNDIFDFPPVK
ncbi:MAG: DUF4349 domain-containing protein [Tannerella sp.]|jgi:hypothetical protein|nr:DUF4349 domain-containing protein [Tannerella sp.]